jgi:PAS domain S-box-containing protein
MTAQQPQHAPVRLLIAETSENAAHRFDSLLRDAGIATRPEIIDLPMALESLASADMMICNSALPDLDRLLPRLAERAPHVPIIVVNNETRSLSPTEVLELGAADAVADCEPKHLVLVVKRELEHVCQYLRLKQTRRALEEAEQRCQLLLQGSKAAIAYVHEGMHIYANDVYLKLFGFDDADDLLGLPLIDLLTPESADTLKRTLKQFRRDQQETNLEFTGASTYGNEVIGTMTFASAEYEGEPCIQVTVRTGSESSHAEAAPNRATTATETSPEKALDDADIPTLTESANGGADVPTANGGSSEGGLDFHLELDEAALDADAAAPAAEADDGEDAFELPDDFLDEPVDTAAHAGAEAERAVDPEAEPAAEADAATVGSLPEPDPSSDKAEHTNGTRKQKQSVTSLGEFLEAAQVYIESDPGIGFAGVFVAQVDNYPELQQTHGLAGAERVCREVQATLGTAAAAPNMPLSGSQWAVVVTGDDKNGALNQVEEYRQAVESLLLEIREKTVRPSVTIGGAALDKEGCDSLATAIEATLDTAFSTLQKAVDDHEGNHVELHHAPANREDLDDAANRVLTLINEAIENQRFMLLFQPIISLRGDSDEHYEVFLRMLDRTGAQMAPKEFLRTAIDNGVANKIDRWVVLQSIKMLSSHRSKGHNTRLTINLTSNSVADPDFIQWLGVAIKAARLPSDAVIFQITERDAATYIRQTREFVEGLKKLHCRSALSRFGLASEPFEILKHIPVDFVKLDGSLIDSLAGNPELKTELTHTIQQLQANGKLTIVPMVESANVLSALWQAGANYIQGHYLQEPSTSMDYDFSTDD